jgi:ABC-type transport system involved in cytochrome c biogenesis permease subunit
MLLMLYMVVGSGTSIFPIHVRGTATLADEMPHIIAGLTATTVMLITMIVGSTALGRKFRIFSWTTLASVLVFGALTVPSGMKLAANEPTPGMGLLERLAYYSMLVWIAGLSLALLRRDEGRVTT